MMFSQETADLVTLTEEILNGKLYFFAVKSWNLETIIMDKRRIELMW